MTTSLSISFRRRKVTVPTSLSISFRRREIDRAHVGINLRRREIDRDRAGINLIVSHGMIKEKGLQFPGTNVVDKTLKPPESTNRFWSCPESGTKFVPGLGTISP